ncbi:uncharacterized mitochondrial protein AtMg00810-like [Malania oleifera]|uniref:uncharacterized mitochondrial protein AtMg00810-like n=1 Tax=Malania oleifera TaxID=397392 RepID=UPI0025AE9BEC|nr:uncharacterized mitochondrial protein AtMg00810-like [Malania oleifera]
MVDCKPMSTPLEANTKGLDNDVPLDDPSFYRGIVGALQYLTLTRPNLSYSVNFVSQFMHAPTIAHLKMVCRILQYIKGTISLGLNFTSHTILDLYAFSDADWNTISRSSIELEYRAMAHTTVELTWLSFTYVALIHSQRPRSSS